MFIACLVSHQGCSGLNSATVICMSDISEVEEMLETEPIAILTVMKILSIVSGSEC